MVEKENKILVSVLIPYYKGKKYIEEAVLSVINQTYKNIEIIVINDSPEDKINTDYIMQLQEKYKFKLVHHDNNMGLTKALMTGFKNSKGEYISILGQDDLFVPEKTQIQIDFFDKYKSYVWVYGNIEKWNQKENTRLVMNVDNTLKRVKEQTILPALYYGNSFAGLYSQSSLAKRQVIEKDILPLWCKLTADVWPVNIRLFEKYPDKIGVIKEPMTIYRLHDNNTINNHFKMFSLIVPTIVEMCPEELHRELIEKNMACLGIDMDKTYNKIKREIKRLFKIR